MPAVYGADRYASSVPDMVASVVGACTLACALVLGIYNAAVLLRVRQTRTALPTGADGIPLAEEDRAARVSGSAVLLVVPAHNEAAVIRRLVASLRAQDHQRFRVVLALDRCTDDTAAAAREAAEGDARVMIHEIAECPEGWAGKVNAIRAGVEAGRRGFEPTHLVFTDADCELHPSCLRASVALAEERGADLLSYLSDYPADTWFERLCQPAAGFELLRQYPLVRANRPDDRQRPFANGQFLLFRAGCYDAIGGHAAVRDELLEDLAFGRLVKQEGFRPAALLAGGLVRCRMYETWADFTRGWKRIFIEGVKRRSDRLVYASRRARVLGAVLPYATPALAGVSAVAGDWVAWAALGATAIWALTTAVVLRMARVPLWVLPAVPVGVWLVADILAAAARDLRAGVRTSWGGREYVREDRAPRRRASRVKAGAA